MFVSDFARRLTSAARLHGDGVLFFNQGKPAEASAAHRQALAILATSGQAVDEYDIQVARILLSLALSDAELYGTESGFIELEKATAIASRLEHEELLALVRGNCGVLYLRAGQLGDAIRELDQAVSKLELVGEFDRGVFLVNRGVAHLYLGQLISAGQDLVRAVEITSLAGLTNLHAFALHNLGYVSFLAGDLPRAISEMEAALAVDEDGSLGGIALLDKARVLIEAGLTHDADHALAKAAVIFERDRLVQDLAEAELARAECALLTSDLGMATVFAERARNRFRRRGSERWRYRAELVLLQAKVTAGESGAGLARRAFRLAEDLALQGLVGHGRTAKLIAAEVLLAKDDLVGATAAVTAAGPTANGDLIAARLHTRLVRAKLEAARGTVPAARREIRTGLRELAKYQASFGSIDMQTASAVHGRRLAELDLSLALDSGRPAGIVAAVEYRRATTRRIRPVRAPEDLLTAQLLSELRQTVESLREAEAGSLSAELRVGLNKVAELQRQIRQRAWTIGGVKQLTVPASTAQIQRALGPDRLMLMFVQSDDVMHILSLDRRRLTVRTAGATVSQIIERISRTRADLDILANDLLPQPIRSVATRSLRASLAWLDSQLIAPFRKDSDELVIVPTGILGIVPWGALPSLREVPVVVTPSATSWVQATTHQLGVDVADELVASIAGPGLAMAEHEASAVAQMWGSRGHAVVGPDASHTAFTNEMTENDVLHVAAHGRHQTDSPLFSSIQLADGPFFAFELDQGSRVPDHVVLAACDLGLSTMRPGDEALGLTSVLLHWGTRCVVAGVARVADEISATTMVDYHRRLASGTSSALALAESVAAVDSESPVPFVCFGADYRP